jgi:hypothetical protein
MRLRAPRPNKVFAMVQEYQNMGPYRTVDPQSRFVR